MSSLDSSEIRQSLLENVSRVLIKVGTRVITDPDSGLDMLLLDRLARQIARLHERDIQVLVVTSGAVHLGRRVLRPSGNKETLTYRQAAAAIGQPELMRHYSESLTAHRLIAAQILLTMDDMADRQRYLHVRNAIDRLLHNHVVPVINENDSVSLEGVTFVENDRLAALVATKMRVDLLVFLSDQPGLCTADPRVDPQARLISVVEPGNDLCICADGAGGPESRGGMRAKLSAAYMAADMGIPVIMADGHEEGVLLRLLAGEEIGTLFVPGTPVGGRKLWIATAAEPVGSISIDAGACKALRQKGSASLLPRGVVNAAGEFQVGDMVAVLGPDGVEIARGLVNYSADEVQRIAGFHTREIANILGHVGHDEIIHRDNLVLTPGH